VSADDPTIAMPTGPSIAVLPFDNLSGDPEQDHFADGITEEIITGLTRFRDLFVIGRNTSHQYKGQSVDVRKIGEELNVRYVVEGTVRRAADTIRISVQLTDATSGANLWAESYDRTLSAENILAVQDEITDQIVSTIADPRGLISRVELLQSRRAATEQLESYECVLRARQFFVELTESAHLQARECLERTVAIDPDYAEAWAWLGEMYLYEFGLGFNVQPDQPDPLNRAFEAGRRAVKLDPRNQFAHNILAQAYYHLNDLDSFHKEADLALNLNPNDANLLGFIGYFKGAAGQWELGASLAKKAMTINPQGATWLWVITIYADHFMRKEYEEALAAIKNWPNPEFFWLHFNLAAVYGQLGDTENARAAWARLLELAPEFENSARDQVEIWIRDKDTVDQLLEGLRKAGIDVPEEPAVEE
jgi:adenylate cyclase